MFHVKQRLRAWLKTRRINRLKAQAREQYAALPTRQLRRQATRKASKLLGTDPKAWD